MAELEKDLEERKETINTLTESIAQLHAKVIVIALLIYHFEKLLICSHVLKSFGYCKYIKLQKRFVIFQGGRTKSGM